MLHNPSSKHFLRLFAPVAVLLLAGVYFYSQAEIARDLSRLKRQDVLNVGLGTEVLSQSLHGVTGDLYFLAGHRALRAAVIFITSLATDDLRFETKRPALDSHGRYQFSSDDSRKPSSRSEQDQDRMINVSGPRLRMPEKHSILRIASNENLSTWRAAR